MNNKKPASQAGYRVTKLTLLEGYPSQTDTYQRSGLIVLDEITVAAQRWNHTSFPDKVLNCNAVILPQTRTHATHNLWISTYISPAFAGAHAPP